LSGSIAVNSIEHIPFTILVDLAEGRNAPGAQERAHIAACGACAADMAWIKRVIELMRSDRSEDAPPMLVARAKQLFRAPNARRASALRRVVAALIFDSALTPLVYGMRAGAPAGRQMIYGAEDFSVDLRVAPIGRLWGLSGQLLGDEGMQSAELSGAPGTAQAALNDLSEFSFPPVPPGQYTLTLRLSDLDIEIPDLQLDLV